MATHSSILAWEMPWAEDPCELQSMESQRAGHDLAAKQLSHRNASGCLCLCLTCSASSSCWPHSGRWQLLILTSLQGQPPEWEASGGLERRHGGRAPGEAAQEGLG